jgi:rSAM/selenodomain-associated transferase 2/rSAM/selenodomain-associated transferase 1
MTPARPTVLGIVIPALNETSRLPALLADLARLQLPHRVVVSDGGSSDGTPEVAARTGASVVHAPPGRARQMNAGAAVLDAQWLLFLHADSRLPPASSLALERWLAETPPGGAAHFRFRVEGEGIGRRLLEVGQGIRERLTGLVYGDQGLVVAADRFRALGGFPDLPLFEDVEMVRMLRRSGPVHALEAPLLTSPRRYDREGLVRRVTRNATLLALHMSGYPPRRLVRWYRPEPAPLPSRTLLVFARAPVPGRVKTRLAAGIGETGALQVYRALGRQVLDQVRDGPWRTVVCHDPPEAAAQMEGWLGTRGIDFAPQSAGDLGARMEQALATALVGGGRACLIGTDAPGVDRGLVDAAFRALDAADVVYGPALDGGYYLVALASPAPTLFRDIPWSTGDVLARSLDRAREAGLRVHLLDPLRDVDTHEDLAALTT